MRKSKKMYICGESFCRKDCEVCKEIYHLDLCHKIIGVI
jgi:hypothetical protein